MKRTRGFDDLPAVLTPREAATLLRIGRNGIYEAIQRGQIPSLKIGRKILIPKTPLIALLEESSLAPGGVREPHERAVFPPNQRTGGRTHGR